MMINVFYKNRNTIGQFMVALIFLGTFGFLFTFDGFVSKSQASGCCGGGEAVMTSFTADSSGDYGSAIPMDAEPTDGCSGGEDRVIPSTSNNGTKCNCATSCSCGSSSSCDGAKTCPDASTCCFDHTDGEYVCQCSSYCGGKGPIKCKDPGIGCDR